MARAGITVNIGVGVGGGAPVDLASVVSATATLVADAASPTQAHVTTLNNAVTPLNAALTGDVWVVWDTSKVTTLSQLRTALNNAVAAALAGYGGALTVP